MIDEQPFYLHPIGGGGGMSAPSKKLSENIHNKNTIQCKSLETVDTQSAISFKQATHSHKLNTRTLLTVNIQINIYK